MGRRADVDWEAIERLYRVGQLTVREIARQHGVAPSSITRRAAKGEWTQDLSEEVRRRTRAALLANATPDATGNATPQQLRDKADEAARRTGEQIDEAVRTNVDVIRQHQRSIGRAHRVATMLLDQLEAASKEPFEVEQAVADETGEPEGAESKAAKAARLRHRQTMLNAVSLPTRASTAAALASTLKNLIPLERKAFNLDEPGGGDAGGDQSRSGDLHDIVRRYQTAARNSAESTE